MKNKLCLVLLCALLPLLSKAQRVGDDEVKPLRVTVSGQAQDRVTRKPVGDMTVYLLSRDSLVVDSTRTYRGFYNGKEATTFAFSVPKGEYILKLVHPQYQTYCQSLRVQASRRAPSAYVSLDLILMKKKPQVRMLDGAVVKATRIKMFHRGDTIVYDADAFNLPQGSMLDVLIAELPGARIYEDGRIFINGKFVDELLLNGKDFFQNDRTVLLENLPAYMVKHLKNYEKETITGASKTNVLDVVLKREYSTGWITNADLGLGVTDRFSGRLFGLGFTNKSRTSAFANINNLNNNHRPGQTGDWSAPFGQSASAGASINRNGGLDYMFNYGRTYFHSSNQLTNYTRRNETIQSTRNFFQTGDVLGHSRYLGRTTSTQLSTSNQFTRHLRDKRGGLSASWGLNYSQGDGRDERASTQSRERSEDEEQDDEELLLVHRRHSEGLTEHHSLSTNGNVGFNLITNIATRDALSGNVSGRYYRNSSKAYSRQQVEYFTAQSQNDYRHQFYNTPDISHDISTNWKYTYNLRRNLNLIPSYTIRHTYQSTDRNLYALERLEGWASPDKRKLDALPSTFDSLTLARDLQNSYYSATTETNQDVHLYVYYNSPKQFLTGANLVFPVQVAHQRLNYDRAGRTNVRRRDLLLFTPSINLTFKHHFGFSYNLSKTPPSLSQYIDIEDNADPLYRRHGNPNLANSTSHQWRLSYNKQMIAKNTGAFSSSISYRCVQKAIAMESLYDSQTGIRTVRPVNIDGNWWLNGQVDWNQAIDKERKDAWHLETRTYYQLMHSVDLHGKGMQALKSAVDNHSTTQEATLKYRKGLNNIGLKCSVRWMSTHSRREGFQPMNSVDFNYGLTLNYRLPWQLQFSTDLTMFSRRGYNSASMNTDDLVWNARLARNLGKHWDCYLNAYDLLGQLSNVVHTVNAQGRVETRYNVVPRYVMLHAVYRLSINPKKNRGQ